MPDGGGKAFLTALRTQAPEQCQRVVFMTAGVSSAELGSFLDRAHQPVLEKPVALETLRAAVLAAAARVDAPA